MVSRLGSYPNLSEFDSHLRNQTMKKEIKTIDKKRGIIRVTSLNERWYAKPITDDKTGLPKYKFYPSDTWIASYYYKSPGLIRWIAERGIDKAEEIKRLAGYKGTTVHDASELIDNGQSIDIQKDKFPNKDTGEMKELTPEGIECIISYRDFIDLVKPELLANELTVFTDVSGGTLDKIFRIKKDIKFKRKVVEKGLYIVDLKTSSNIWEEFILQISSYSHSEINYKEMGITDEEWRNRKLAILQLGYNKTVEGRKYTDWKWTIVPDKYDLFRNVAYKIWQNENPNAKPKERDYPLVIESDFRTKQNEQTKK